MDLIRSFSNRQFADGLASWRWIGLAGRAPLFTSAFGDVFFGSDDGVWWLDTLEGSLTRHWDGMRELEADLALPGSQDRYLLAGLAWAAERLGIVPGPDEVLDFTVPPVLGGAVDVDNIQTMDFVVGLDIAGQIHEQIHNLPPGTPITGIRLEEP